MPRNYKLRWVASENRWRKTYRGKQFSHSGDGKCKSYDDALQAYVEWKAAIDADLGPEKALSEVVHQLDRYQELIAYSLHDTHASRGQWEAIERLKQELKERHAERQGRVERDEKSGRNTPPLDLQSVAQKRIAGINLTYGDATPKSVRMFSKPIASLSDPPAARWSIRLRPISPFMRQVMRSKKRRRSIVRAERAQMKTVEIIAPPTPQGTPPWEAGTPTTLGDLLKAFVDSRRREAAAGGLSQGRVEQQRIHAERFVEWAGRKQGLEKLSGSILLGYRDQVLDEVSKGLSSYTARDRLANVKSLVKFAFKREYIDAMPKCLDDDYQVSLAKRAIETISKDEIFSLLHHATRRQRLYLLLGLNCGFYAGDIADTRISEIDLNKGTITRKRSKTKSHENVPTVAYKLWPETMEVVREFIERSGDVAFRSETGGTLITQKVNGQGRLTKNDAIHSSWKRLQQASNSKSQHKLLRKTGATWLESSERFHRFGELYLCHAPQTIKQIHYAAPDLKGFHEALDAMREALILQ
jgi:integrase